MGTQKNKNLDADGILYQITRIHINVTRCKGQERISHGFGIPTGNLHILAANRDYGWDFAHQAGT